MLFNGPHNPQTLPILLGDLGPMVLWACQTTLEFGHLFAMNTIDCLKKKLDNEVKKTSYGVLRENADGNDTVPISV